MRMKYFFLLMKQMRNTFLLFTVQRYTFSFNQAIAYVSLRFVFVRTVVFLKKLRSQGVLSTP